MSRQGTASRQAVGRRAYLELGREGGGDGAAEQGPSRGALAKQTVSRRAPLQGRRRDDGDPLLPGTTGLLLFGGGGAPPLQGRRRDDDVSFNNDESERVEGGARSLWRLSRVCGRLSVGEQREKKQCAAGPWDGKYKKARHGYCSGAARWPESTAGLLSTTWPYLAHRTFFCLF